MLEFFNSFTLSDRAMCLTISELYPYDLVALTVLLFLQEHMLIRMYIIKRLTYFKGKPHTSMKPSRRIIPDLRQNLEHEFRSYLLSLQLHAITFSLGKQY
ncbi:hypothetical protein KC19_2G260400 [Ceratodon purpureus]|uniref:Uncharacterized protein n=1 Tax=Ceratodon purpureus TaxID=3225 RepID=A0A8T0J1Y2_CERPU|nr:hypothetical protein KC19_2G260400 [Ceratodon purpureus]